MNLQREAPPLVLASGSPVRAKLLKDAGLRFTVIAPELDESLLVAEARGHGYDAPLTARALAERKALLVSARRPDSLVIGADQILTCGESWFEKPRNPDEAAGQLRTLSGREHRLASGVACARGGKLRWAEAREARLRFRGASEEFLQAVLDADAAEVGTSVGGYRLEGPGILLCDEIEGDHFTILGLPLLPLLGFLRREGILTG